jgi:hypothetical protein
MAKTVHKNDYTISQDEDYTRSDFGQPYYRLWNLFFDDADLKFKTSEDGAKFAATQKSKEVREVWRGARGMMYLPNGCVFHTKREALAYSLTFAIASGLVHALSRGLANSQLTNEGPSDTAFSSRKISA